MKCLCIYMYILPQYIVLNAKYDSFVFGLKKLSLVESIVLCMVPTGWWQFVNSSERNCSLCLGFNEDYCARLDQFCHTCTCRYLLEVCATVVARAV